VSERIEISFAPAEGAVLRMLGLVERRGFIVSGMAMKTDADRASLTLDVAPRDAGRGLDVMARQLRRLVDVQSVSITPHHSGPSA